MKKTLVTLLALVFVLSIGATALAAPANPFVDVPAKHWAYDAVSKLAKAGIVDGYGDGTFKGDKLMTRYEMAQVVAKAMARSDKADAANKALIDKLAVEFAAELNNLGVRVAKLEANASSIKFSGDARVRYQNNYSVSNAGVPVSAGERFQQRLRINMASTLNDTTSFTGRLTAESTSRTDVAGGDANNTYSFEIGKFTFKNALNSGWNVEIGRDALAMGYGFIAGASGGFDNVRLVKPGAKLSGFVAIGDVATKVGTGISTAGVVSGPALGGVATAGAAINVTVAEVVWTPDKKWNFTGNAYLSNTANYNYEVFGIGSKYTFDPNWALVGYYAYNAKEGAATVQGATDNKRNAYWAQLQYKGAAVAKPGSFGIYAQYEKIGNAAIEHGLPSRPVFEYTGADPFVYKYGVKGMGYGFQYVPVKNVLFTLTYESLKAYDGSVDRPKFTYARCEFYF